MSSLSSLPKIDRKGAYGHVTCINDDVIVKKIPSTEYPGVNVGAIRELSLYTLLLPQASEYLPLVTSFKYDKSEKDLCELVSNLDNQKSPAMDDIQYTNTQIFMERAYSDLFDIAHKYKLHVRVRIALVRKWFNPLVKSLQALHSAGILHRDVKPFNCLLMKGEFINDKEKINCDDDIGDDNNDNYQKSERQLLVQKLLVKRKRLLRKCKTQQENNDNNDEKQYEKVDFDMCPELYYTGRVVLCDLGNSQLQDRDYEAGMTTAAFSAPEAILKKRRVKKIIEEETNPHINSYGIPADVYSLGATLISLIKLFVPSLKKNHSNTGNNDGETLTSLESSTCKWHDWTKTASTLDSTLLTDNERQVLQKMVAKRPEDRWTLEQCYSVWNNINTDDAEFKSFKSTLEIKMTECNRTIVDVDKFVTKNTVRECIIDWMSQVCEEYKCSKPTLINAVQIFDDVWDVISEMVRDSPHLRKKIFQMTAIVALSLSSKFNDDYRFDFSDYNHHPNDDESIGVWDLHDWEFRMFDKLHGVISRRALKSEWLKLSWKELIAFLKSTCI